MRRTHSQQQNQQQHQRQPENVSSKNTCSATPVQTDLKDMIDALRVFELKKILSFVQVTRTGCKKDLQCRIHSLLNTNIELMSAKIKEIYLKSNFLKKQKRQMQQQNIQCGLIKRRRFLPKLQMAAPLVECQCQSNDQSKVNVTNNSTVHCLESLNNITAPFQLTNSVQSSPMSSVRLKKLTFYDVLEIIIKPSPLLPRKKFIYQEDEFLFTLTPQELQTIISGRYIGNNSKEKYSIQIQLRFCLLDTISEQKDIFPPSLSIKVNNTLGPDIVYEMPLQPINITKYVILSSTIANIVTVQWCPNILQNYCITGCLVGKLSTPQLLDRMKIKSVKPFNYTKELIKEKLTDDDDGDCEIATTELQVSLNCPLGKTKISIPCRATTCSHLQCFDARLYLEMNERKPTWKCPVCSRSAVYDDLMIDGFFREILSKFDSYDTTIQLHKDGSWSQLTKRSNISGPLSTRTIETIDLTLSDSDDNLLTSAREKPQSKRIISRSISSSR